MDACIHALLKFARNKAFDRLSKLEKGKSTNRIRTIAKRHHTSSELPTDLVKANGDHTWTVDSASGKATYTVSQEAISCTSSCALKCDTWLLHMP